MHLFYFNSAHDVLHVLTIKEFVLHSATKFLCEQKRSFLWRWQCNVALFISNIQLQTQITQVVFSDCSKNLKPTNWHKVYHTNNQSTLPPLLPNRFFDHSDPWWSLDQMQRGTFFHWLRVAEERALEQGCLQTWKDWGNNLINFFKGY